MKNKIIETRQELTWHIISNSLENIFNLAIAHKDKVFEKMLMDIQDYVDGKLALNSDGDILECYVTVLQKQKD